MKLTNVGGELLREGKQISSNVVCARKELFTTLAPILRAFGWCSFSERDPRMVPIAT
jgi:hypothetical protein